MAGLDPILLFSKSYNNSFSSRMGKYQIKRLIANMAKLKKKKKLKFNFLNNLGL
jgi:hypothetical protein